MQTIFKKEDFKLCLVPVPYGYKQSQTHSGVAIHEGDFYLTTSPYPNYSLPGWLAYLRAIFNKLTFNRVLKPFVAEEFENPCLYLSEAPGDNYSHKFRLLQSTPLMPSPDPYYGLPAFNSDPDIFIEGNEIHILNRIVYRTKMCPGEPLNKYINRLFHIYGYIDERRFKYMGTELLLETDSMLVSPCLCKINGEYVLTELETNSYNNSNMFDGLFLAKANSINEFKTSELNWNVVVIDSENYIPWHMSLFIYNSKLYTIIACVKKGESHRCWQMFGEFNETLSELKIFQTPLTDYKSYRGAACVTDEGEFVLYNTTVQEKIKGSKSVDGRDVIMAHMPFEKLLSILRDKE